MNKFKRNIAFIFFVIIFPAFANDGQFDTRFYNYTNDMDLIKRFKSLTASSNCKVYRVRGGLFSIGLKNGANKEVLLNWLTEAGLLKQISEKSLVLIECSISEDPGHDEVVKLNDDLQKLGWNRVVVFSHHNSGIDVHLDSGPTLTPHIPDTPPTPPSPAIPLPTSPSPAKPPLQDPPATPSISINPSPSLENSLPSRMEITK